MKVQATCDPKLPTFDELPFGAVYANGNGDVRTKVKASGSSPIAYVIDVVTGVFSDRTNKLETTVNKVYPNATLVLEPSK